MLYELLTGTVPFEGDSVVAIALRHLSEPPAPPSTLVLSISPNLDAIVMRALEKDPERRFADADEFLSALEAERERLRRDDGSHTAALAPLAPLSVLPGPAYSHPASYTTQPIGPIGPATGVYGTAPTYWDPNTTGIIPPGSIVLPPGSRARRPIWPWVLFGVLVAAAAIAALAIVLVRDRSPKVVQVSVPYVVGLAKADAQAILTDDGLKYTESLLASQRTAGTVIAQVPSHETKIPKGSNVAITISTGPPKPLSRQVPNVIGINAATATHQLHVAGFTVSPIKQASTAVAKNAVISTNPNVGSNAAKGSTVVVTISSGPPRVAVPNVVDETLTSAKLLLQQRGFVVNAVPKASSQPAGTVLAQTPSSGKAPQGSTVTLTVAKAPAPVVLPRLLGLKKKAAVRQLVKLGLLASVQYEVRDVNPQYDGRVISQQPPVDSSVPAGSTVVIVVESYVAPVTPITPVGPTGSSGSSGATGPT
jgi:serine/threonine-protein kinase